MITPPKKTPGPRPGTFWVSTPNGQTLQNADGTFADQRSPAEDSVYLYSNGTRDVEELDVHLNDHEEDFDLDW